LLITVACARKPNHNSSWVPYDESKELLAETADNESVRLRFKLIQSRVLDKTQYGKTLLLK
jgi:amidase